MYLISFIVNIIVFDKNRSHGMWLLTCEFLLFSNVILFYFIISTRL